MELPILTPKIVQHAILTLPTTLIIILSRDSSALNLTQHTGPIQRALKWAKTAAPYVIIPVITQNLGQQASLLKTPMYVMIHPVQTVNEDQAFAFAHALFGDLIQKTGPMALE